MKKQMCFVGALVCSLAVGCGGESTCADAFANYTTVCDAEDVAGTTEQQFVDVCTNADSGGFVPTTQKQIDCTAEVETCDAYATCLGVTAD